MGEDAEEGSKISRYLADHGVGTLPRVRIASIHEGASNSHAPGIELLPIRGEESPSQFSTPSARSIMHQLQLHQVEDER